jgi:chromosome segregation ATPase
MNTPTPTPRTDAATYPADCLGTTLVTHRDCSRALEREVAALTVERDQLRAALALGQENCDAVYDELRGDCDELRGDVVRLATERDQLRAENTTLRAAQKACEACDEPTAFEVRQLRAEFEKLTIQVAQTQDRNVSLRFDADQLRAEVERLRADRDCEKRLRKDADEFRENAIARAERYRLASLKLEAELAAERARLDWVFHNCKVEANDYTTGNRDVYAIHDREDLGAAMKEDAK